MILNEVEKSVGIYRNFSCSLCLSQIAKKVELAGPQQGKFDCYGLSKTALSLGFNRDMGLLLIQGGGEFGL